MNSGIPTISNPVKSEAIQKANTIIADSFSNKSYLQEIKEQLSNLELEYFKVTVDKDKVGFIFKGMYVDRKI